MERLEHPDGTRCRGHSCAWAGDPNHVSNVVNLTPEANVRNVKECCPQCGRRDEIYDVDEGISIQRFTLSLEGEKQYDDVPEHAPETTTVGIQCNACGWHVDWGRDAARAGTQPSTSDLLLSLQEFDASWEAREAKTVEEARREALRLMKEM